METSSELWRTSSVCSNNHMYCPACGKDVNPELSYCNHCGARLSAEADPRALPAGNFNMLLGALIGIPLVGVVMIFVLVAALKNGFGLRDDFVFGMAFLTFVLLAIAEVGCIVMLLTRTKAPKNVKGSAANYPTPLAGGVTRGLGPQTFEPMPVGSVTDHTTRTLENAPRPGQDDRGK